MRLTDSWPGRCRLTQCRCAARCTRHVPLTARLLADVGVRQYVSRSASRSFVKSPTKQSQCTQYTRPMCVESLFTDEILADCPGPRGQKSLVSALASASDTLGACLGIEHIPVVIWHCVDSQTSFVKSTSLYMSNNRFDDVPTLQ